MRTIKRILLAFAGLAGLFVALNLLLLVTQSSILMRQQVFEKGQPYYFVPPRQAGEVERGGVGEGQKQDQGLHLLDRVPVSPDAKLGRAICRSAVRLV